MKFSEIVYMILDELKLSSDDAQFTEDHILFLVDKYRAFILKQKYSDIKKDIPDSNYQSINIDLEQDNSRILEERYILRSVNKIPDVLNIGKPKVYPIDFLCNTEITYISRDRLRYTGFNKYLKNIIYCTIETDQHLYFLSKNPQLEHLKKINFFGIFNNSINVLNKEDVMQEEFPLESALVPVVIEFVIKELSGAIYRPDDENNNAKDDLVNKSIQK